MLQPSQWLNHLVFWTVRLCKARKWYFIVEKKAKENLALSYTHIQDAVFELRLAKDDQVG